MMPPPPPSGAPSARSNHQNEWNGSSQIVQNHHMVPYVTSPTIPSIPLYPTGKAALIPTPMTYELIPNRIFVGGFPTSTTETELREHFDAFFPVKDVKMVKSLDGVSKGYGFITFETEDQAEAIRKLNPKQLEFRNRKLNLGPAIRNINTSVFPPGFPGYLIATPSPSPFPLQAGSPQVFVYPSVMSHEPVKSPESPNGQPPQVFFPDQQEPVRTYANAVSGVEKSEPETPKPQPLNKTQNTHQFPHHWNGPEIVELPPSPVQQYPNYAPPQNGGQENNGGYQPVQMPFFYPPTIYHQPNFAYMNQQPLTVPYYHPPISYQHSYQNNQNQHQQNNGYPNNHQQQPQQQQPVQFVPFGGGNGYQDGYHDDNSSSFSRPLQAPPRAGKKSRKASERGAAHEKNGYQPVPMQFYMNSQGMYQPNVNYLTPPPYAQQNAPYWIQPPGAPNQQHQNQNGGSFGYNHNHHNQNHHNHHYQSQNNSHNNNGGYGDGPDGYYNHNSHNGGYGYHGANDESSFPRPLQAPKKNWKESLEKRKSPVKGSRNADKSSPPSRRTSTSSPSHGAQKSSTIPSLTDSLQNLTVSSSSSPAKN